jgi:heptosyltransferase-3
MTGALSDYKRILIIATRQIGDVLCTTPLMRRTRELWPNATIDVLGYEKTMGMLAGNSDINEVIESSEHPKWPEYKQLIKRIFRRYDLAIVTQPSDRAHIYGLLAAPRRVGMVPNNRAHNWWKKLLSIHTVELDYWRQHVVLERLRLLDKFRQEPDPEEVVSRALNVSVIPPSAETLPGDLISFVSAGPVVVIHGTPMWRFKRWPTANWVDLISYLVEVGHNIVLTGSSSDQDRDLNSKILEGLQCRLSKNSLMRVRDYAGRLSLGQTTTLLKAARLFVGVDTSITHLAAACGVHTVALFGATAPTNFGPWPQNAAVSGREKSVWLLHGETQREGGRIQVRDNVTLIQGPGVCVPCRKAGCLDKFESHSDCLNNLSPKTLFRALQTNQKIGAE